MKSGCAKTTFAGTREEIRQIGLAGAEDARRTIHAAERALPSDASTGNSERLEQLRTLHEAET